ncbi:GNAT family N-acetyltransferase [Alkalihalophilus marmarensis]|jgi:RimJ/RimL family protein N-acetyltransferase|uniref:GNAT family N-acetyltransferase n=1 Tax=Alkalihalophilus marmarensis TaxID=521377 RepID=UPI00203E941F|nr:GNAT family protein [Alkalihalophilus marmarensis]MCM3490030.1 GNAT family N-acetyltransferase [Alkalihalophilus marmarensis]
MIHLLPLNSDDLQIVYEIYNESFIQQNAVIGTSFPQSDKKIEDKINRWIRGNDQKHFKISDAQEEIIGLAQVFNLDFINRKAQIGILIKQKHTSKGYGKLTLKALINFCFYELNLHKIEVEILEYNEASMQLFIKNGFILEGTLKESAFKNGNYVNVNILSLINKN